MTKHNYIINQITEALESTVPTRHYVAAIQALKRCQELLSEGSVHVTNADAQKDMRTYAGLLDAFFDDVNDHGGTYFDITNGYDPTAHLTKLGIIKPLAKAKTEKVAQPPVKKKTKKGKK
jgi:hypothetical protein